MFSFQDTDKFKLFEEITVISGKLIFFAQFLFVLHFFVVLSLISRFLYVLKKKRNIVYILWKNIQKQLVSIEFTKFFVLLEKKIEKNYFFSRIYNFYQFFRSKLIKQGWRHLRIKHCAPTFAHARLRIHLQAQHFVHAQM